MRHYILATPASTGELYMIIALILHSQCPSTPSEIETICYEDLGLCIFTWLQLQQVLVFDFRHKGF